MAKAKEEKQEKNELDILIDKYGEGSFITGDKLKDYAHGIVSVSPKLNLILGGGIPGGSVVTLAGPPKIGKALWKESLVMTPNGPQKICNIKNGDIVSTPDGITSKVIGVYPQGKIELFKITFSDGDSSICSLDHLWSVKSRHKKQNDILTTKQIIDSGLYIENGKRNKWFIQLPVYTYYNTQDIPINPYLLGLLLGDGCITTKSIRFFNIDKQIIKDINKVLPDGYILKKTKENKCGYRINCNSNINTLRVLLDKLSLYGCNSHSKFIPDCYKYNSKEIRLDIIRGLMDTDGSAGKKGSIECTTTSIRMANDIKEIIESLGGICRIIPRYTKCNGKKFLSYRCNIRHQNNKQFFNLKRKIVRARKRSKGILMRSIKSIEPYIKDDAICIKIENPNGLFMTNNHIVTHNSVTSLTIAANAQKQGRKVFYCNIEGRIKERDLAGIHGLDQEKLVIIRSHRNPDGTSRIMVAHEYLDCVEVIANTVPGAVIIVDSISQLLTEGEKTGNLEDSAYAPGAKLMSSLCKRLCNVISVNDIILIGILHITANFARFGKNTSITGGNKIKYACDVGLVCTKFSYLKEGGKEDDNDDGGIAYGQKVHWVTTSTALNAAPCQSTDSIIRYGMGIDHVAELVQLGVDLGFITKRGSWFIMSYMEDKVENYDKSNYTIQGELNLINRIRDNKEEYDILEKCVNEMILK